MLILHDISYEIGGKTILDGVSFTLDNTEKAGLVGANGVGKTTLFRLITRAIIPSSGNVSFSPRSLSVGHMPQTVAELDIPEDSTVFDFLLSGRPIEKISSQIKSLTDCLAKNDDKREQQLALEELGQLQEEFERWRGYSAEDELLRIIAGLRMESIDLEAKVSALSGGEKSRVNFARVLYSNPDILLLDEPTNHLDNKSKEWLVWFIKQFSGSVLIISHDASFLDSVVSKIIRLDQGSSGVDVFHGNYTHHVSILAQRSIALQRVAEKQEKEMRRLREYLDRMQGISGKQKRQVASRKKRFEQLKQDKLRAIPSLGTVRTRLSLKRKSREIPLAVRDVCYGYEKNKLVLSQISFVLTHNERLVIVGVNGVGKSTLLKLIMGSLSPLSGEIVVGPKTDIGYYAQEHEGIDLENTVLEEISKASKLSSRGLRSVLANFLFRADMVFQQVSTLSPGERSRLALAKLSLCGANLLLLDEPTNHLDIATSLTIAQVLHEYEGSLIVVSHDVAFLEALGVERMLMLPQGEVVYYDRNIIEHSRSLDGENQKKGVCHV
ncbi:MAG: ribosomal protection-like ABC-F family protein [Patescibacteria group bacterium]